MNDDTPRRGSLVLCGLGHLGVITDDEQQKVTYADGNEGTAYVGIHVVSYYDPTTDHYIKAGDPWSSRNPKVLCRMSNILAILHLLINQEDKVLLENEGE